MTSRSRKLKSVSAGLGALLLAVLVAGTASAAHAGDFLGPDLLVSTTSPAPVTPGPESPGPVDPDLPPVEEPVLPPVEEPVLPPVEEPALPPVGEPAVPPVEEPAVPPVNAPPVPPPAPQAELPLVAPQAPAAEPVLPPVVAPVIVPPAEVSPVQPEATATPSPAFTPTPKPVKSGAAATVDAPVSELIMKSQVQAAVAVATGSPLAVQMITILILLAAGFAYFRFVGSKSRHPAGRAGK